MKQDREQELLERLSSTKKISLSDAMDLLGVSESTARRMFAKLEREGLVIRTHGGIQCVDRAVMNYSFEQRFQINASKKAAIAQEACALLTDGDVVFLDSGTTMQHLCVEIARRIAREKLAITVYTNSLVNLELLAPHAAVHVVGGQYRENRKDFCGYLAEHALDGLYFTKCFLGADGCAQGRRFTTTDFETARMNEIAMRNSRRVVMLVDSSKFSTISNVAYAPAGSIDVVVTDTGIDAETLAYLEGAGAEVIRAKKEESA